MQPEFAVHRLNERGLKYAEDIAESFDDLLITVRGIVPEGRCLSIVKTKLEEACFFAKKGMAESIYNQE